MRLIVVWASMTFIYAISVGWLLASTGMARPEMAILGVIAGFWWRDIWPSIMRGIVRRDRRKAGWS